VASSSSFEASSPSFGVPASMMRPDGTMINGLLPARPYY
jgi:hypothetical protein